MASVRLAFSVRRDHPNRSYVRLVSTARGRVTSTLLDSVRKVTSVVTAHGRPHQVIRTSVVNVFPVITARKAPLIKSRVRKENTQIQLVREMNYLFFPLMLSVPTVLLPCNCLYFPMLLVYNCRPVTWNLSCMEHYVGKPYMHWKKWEKTLLG